nr:hypothetical protein [Methylorubrum zatmanii]
MIVEDLAGQAIVSTRKLDRIEFLDGGDTLVVHLTCSDYQTVAVIMPRTAVQALVSALADDLASNSSSAKKLKK